MDSRRYKLVPDPRRVRFEKYLDSLPCWEIPDFTVEELETLNLPPGKIEVPKYTQPMLPGL